MTPWLRRARGAIGIGLTWAAAWAAAWAVTGLLIGVTSVLTPWLPWGGFFAVFDAPLPALAVPGVVGGTLWSLTTLMSVPFALMGAGCAASSLVIARRGDDQTRLAAGDVSDAPALSDADVR